jgi:hypothetical protein
VIAGALGLARAVPVWVWALAALLAWGGFQKHRAAGATREAAVAEMRAEVATATGRAEAEARQREYEIATTAQEAADAYRSNLARAQRAAAGARTELDRLRLAAATAAPACSAGAGASAPSGTHDAAGLLHVLGECGAALQTMAADAGADAARLSGLQAYVRAIGAAPRASAASAVP